MNTALPVLFLLASARAQAEPPCSLNGKASTVNGKASCVCDKPWSGALCETMNFKPATYPQGYGMAPNLTSWGGNTIYDAASKEYHIYVSAMTNHCPLQTWGKNSRIDHGVSKTITGPYALRDVAINTWAHNSAPIALKDGTFAIVHIGTGTGPPNGGQNCNKSAYDGPLLAPDAADAHTTADSYVASTAGGSTIHTAKSLAGPWYVLLRVCCLLCCAVLLCALLIWLLALLHPPAADKEHREPLMKNTLGGCNNPAPWVHPNGTIFCVCGGSLKSAESICGPWTTVTSFSHKGGPAGNYEDPFLYTDHNGHFHLIYHVYVPKPAYTCINR